ncbi:MAG: sulfite exporter TauE/SafE family protein [Candidatus Hodarchaeales archaeon]
MEYLIYIIFFFLSIGIGVVGVIGGFGGGVFLFPILILAGFPIEIAAANSLISLFLPSVLATIHNHRRNEINYKLGIGFEIPTAVGAIIGANLTLLLPSTLMYAIFGCVAFIMAYMMIKDLDDQNSGKIVEKSIFKRIMAFGPKLKQNDKEASSNIGFLMLVLSGAISGMLAGMFGIGAGWIKAPLMITGFGVPSNIASATATFMIVITSAVGGYTHFLHGNLDIIFFPLTLGLIIGAEIGCRIRDQIQTILITKVVIISLVIIGCTMLTRIIFSF